MAGPKYTLSEPLTHPVIHAYEEMGLDVYDWQIGVLNAIYEQWRGADPVALRAANDSGKTTYIVAVAVDWFLTEYPKGKVVITSGAFRQVKDQLWPALTKFRELHPEWRYASCDIRTNGDDIQDGGFAIGFSTDNAGRAEGWHGDGDDAPLMYIVDEAKTVADGIFEAVDRCNADFTLFVSSPGAPEGQFYRCFTSEKGLHQTFRVTSDDCEHLDPSIKERDLKKYGPNHPLFKSKHDADFDADSDRVILSPADLAACMERKPVVRTGPRYCFLDFAAGGDENAMAIKDGNRVWLEAAWYEADTMAAVEEFIARLRNLKFVPGQVFADNGGLGKPIIDRFHELGWPINRVNNGEAPNDPGYANRGSELWFVGARMFQMGEVIPVDFDPTTVEQLTGRKVAYASQGRDSEGLLMAEPKPKMKERGLTSPDRGDAIMGVLGVSDSGNAMTAEQARGVRTPANPFKVKRHKF